MANSKPQIAATIKFRDVTIENMTLQELKDLRDVLNELVGEPPKTVERVIERHDHIYPWRPYTVSPYPNITWAVSSGTSSNSISLGQSSGSKELHYDITCD